MNIALFGPRVMIKLDPEPEENKSPGGILLPDAVKLPKKNTMIGEVIEVGAEVKSSLTKGDKIYFFRAHLVTVQGPDGDYGLVREEDILGKVT